MKLKKPELKRLLRERGLPHSGTKAQMASRMTAHDNTQSVTRQVHDLQYTVASHEISPFRFLELPSEIRNETYALVAAEATLKNLIHRTPKTELFRLCGCTGIGEDPFSNDVSRVMRMHIVAGFFSLIISKFGKRFWSFFPG